MAAIPSNFGTGHANLAPGGQGKPTLAQALRDIADDLDGLQVATITSPNGVAAAGANPTKAEFDAVVTLVNEIKTKINTTAAVTLLTTKV